jgi:hypothetical protein
MTTPQIHPIATTPPEFPCWLYHSGNRLMHPQWQHSSKLIQSLAVSPYTTHWSPDAPTAPQVVPDATEVIIMSPVYSPSPAPATDWKEAAAMDICDNAFDEDRQTNCCDFVPSRAAAIIARHAAPMEKELAEAKALQQKCLNSVVEASVAFPNIGSYLAQTEGTITALRTSLAKWKDCAEYGWTIIANSSGGNWSLEPKDWQTAAAKFRDESYYPCLALTESTVRDEIAALKEQCAVLRAGSIEADRMRPELADLRTDAKGLREALELALDFAQCVEVAEDRSNLDGDTAEVVLEQLNASAEDVVAKLNAALRATEERK